MNVVELTLSVPAARDVLDELESALEKGERLWLDRSAVRNLRRAVDQLKKQIKRPIHVHRFRRIGGKRARCSCGEGCIVFPKSFTERKKRK